MAKETTGTGSYDQAYLMAAALLLLAGILTFVTRGIEKRYKAATAPPVSSGTTRPTERPGLY